MDKSGPLKLVCGDKVLVLEQSQILGRRALLELCPEAIGWAKKYLPRQLWVVCEKSLQFTAKYPRSLIRWKGCEITEDITELPLDDGGSLEILPPPSIDGPPIATRVRVDEKESGPLKRPAEDVLETPSKSQRAAMTVFFVPVGTDMPPQLIRGSKKVRGLVDRVESRGAEVIHEFSWDNPPSHLVVSEHIKPSTLAEYLEVGSVDELALRLQQKNITVATRRWLKPGDQGPLPDPRLEDRMLGLLTSGSVERSSSTVSRRRRHNKQLAQVFRKLAKLLQEAPIQETDDWRAYMFSLIAGRLERIGFDIDFRDATKLQRFRETKGVGDSTVNIAREFLETGSVSRIDELTNDPDRVAMRTMMKIWGVGKVTATKLVQKGLRSLGDVKKAIEDGSVVFDRNQYLGLIYYDDIQLEMSRSEVKEIGDIVSTFIHRRYPSAVVTVMGSYRRGKERCGDVDILIVDKEQDDSIHPRALGETIDDLRLAGHLVHHLTHVSGMKRDMYETLSPSIASKLTKPRKYGTERGGTHTCSSYMGIFKSPLVENRVRRVDIKFYPYRERVFASLYFTGNGHFNRSMRLWATRKFNYTLNDHGLFHCDSGDSIIEASSEKEVFEKLKMIWKEPSERDSFDAVEVLEDEQLLAEIELSRSELRNESEAFRWVN